MASDKMERILIMTMKVIMKIMAFHLDSELRTGLFVLGFHKI